MANPIKTSDILQDDGAIQKAIDQLKDFQKQAIEAISAVKEEAKQLKKELKGVNATTAKGREQTEESAKKTDELTRRLKKYEESLTENAKKIAALKLAQQQLNRVNKLTAKQNTALEGSYDDLSAQLSLAKIRWKQLSEEQRDNTKEGKELTAYINDLNERLKELDSTVGVHSRNVGNYKEAILEARDASGSFNDILNLIRKNPVLGIIGALIAVVGALFNAFTKSEKGAKLMNKASGVLAAVMSQLVDISVRLYDVIVGVFEDPIGSMKAFGEAIIENVVNRVKGSMDLFLALGKVVGNTLVLDFEAAKEAAKEAGTAIVQMGTGLDAKQQEEFAEGVKKLTKEIEKEAEAFAKLYERQRQVRGTNRSLIRQIDELAAKEQILSQVAGDATLGFKEQAAAAEELEGVLQKKGELELKLAKNNLALINQEIKLRRANQEEIEDLLDQQVSAIAAVGEAETALTLGLLENATERRQIRRDEFERELDFAIDILEAQLMQNERRAKADKISLQERAKIIDESRELNEQSFQDQIQLLEDFTGKKLGLDELVLESDERVIRERLRGHELDDIVLGRILEVIRERKAVTQDLIELESDLVALREKAASKVPEKINPIDFGEKVDAGVKDRIAKSIADTLRDARIQAREELEKEPPQNLFDFLGFDLDDTQERGFQAIGNALQFAKDQLTEFAAKRVELANQNVNVANEEVASAQRALQAEIENRNAGFAHNEETARKELDSAKARQKEALAEQRKAQKAEQRIQTIQQAGNLITAASKILFQVPFPFNIAAVGIMLGSFIAAKVKANQLTKKQFGKGTYMDIDWAGSHESGNDVPIGLTKDGKQVMTVEKGESMAVFNKKAVQRHGKNLKDLVYQINSGQFKGWESSVSTVANTPIYNFQNSNNTDTSVMEGHLGTISRNTERHYSADGKIEWYKNHKVIYN